MCFAYCRSRVRLASFTRTSTNRATSIVDLRRRRCRFLRTGNLERNEIARQSGGTSAALRFLPSMILVSLSPLRLRRCLSSLVACAGITATYCCAQSIFYPVEPTPYANKMARVQLPTIKGGQMPPPYGGKQRSVMVDLNLPALQAKGLSPIDVVNAVSAQNLIAPSGTVKIDRFEYAVETNSQRLGVT